MPTNILRRSSKAPAVRDARERAPNMAMTDRIVVIRAGRVAIRARLLDTPTADRIWRALPILSAAQLWGQGEVFFETRIESGRERGAKTIVVPGEVVFSPDRDVIAIPFGPTPVSKAGELRLWSPSNVWAHAIDDVGALGSVRPGERVEVVKAQAQGERRSCGG